MIGRASALVASLVCATPALAAPKVGVIVLSHEGLPDAASDQVASELAVAVATQIEGEALSGPSVADKLAAPISEGCEESPKCGRDAAAELGVDEALLLAMHLAGKTLIVDCYRVPRDPSHKPSQATLRLLGAKGKRTQAMLELVAGLYPLGSVVEAAAAPPPRAKPARVPPPAQVAAEADEKPAHPAIDDEPPPVDAKGQAKRRKKILFYSLIGGGAVVLVALAVILGVALGTTGSPTGASIQLP